MRVDEDAAGGVDVREILHSQDGVEKVEPAPPNWSAPGCPVEKIRPLTLFVKEDDLIVNPLGVKGIGELGMVGIPAAIANGISTRRADAFASCRSRRTNRNESALVETFDSAVECD